MLAECIAFGCSPNKAVVGANAFAHESGIHQDGMMANPLAYGIMTPESVGAGHTKLVLGKHSGRRALADRLEKLGHPLDRKKSIYDQDLLGLLQPGKSTSVATV
jgi:2-isopropylmalate synthase